MDAGSLFPVLRLPEDLVAALRRMNPWWEGKPTQILPETRRHLVGQIHRRLDAALAPIVVVRGPRQIGKTTAQLQVVTDLIDRGVPPGSILRVQFDELPALEALAEPVLRVVEWFESNIAGKTLNEIARAGEPAYLFFDEVQNLPTWAPQLKSLVDHATTRVVVTGSSALRIERGRDSLAGRITTLEAGVLSLTEIGEFRSMGLGAPFLADNGLHVLTDQQFWIDLRRHGEELEGVKQRAFAAFSDRGGYPLAHKIVDAPWPELADQLNETVIRRVIRHDLRLGDRGRKRDEQLLEEVFRLACDYVGQTPSMQLFSREANRTLDSSVGEQRVRHYLRFLGDTLLLRLIEPLEIRLKKRRGQPKICLCDHGLRASWLQEVVPLDADGLAALPELGTLAGRIAESVVGALLSTVAGLDLAHLPARQGDPEVDFVLTVGTRRIPLEVKYRRRIDALQDTEGLRTFLEKTANNAPFALLVTQDGAPQAPDPRVVTLPLSTLMLLR